MKKTNFFAFVYALILISSVFVSCGKKSEVIDEYGFFIDNNAAFKDAQSKGRPLIVMVTSEGDDALSEYFLEMARTEDFKNKVTGAFTVLHMDFSEKVFKSTVIDDSASKAQVKAANQKIAQLQDNLQMAKLLNVQNTPAFYILTKDEYFITELRGEVNGETYIPSTVDQFLELILNSQEKIAYVNNLVEKAKNGSKLDRIAAIDELFENTDYNMRVFLADLVETVIKLDKENESGLLSKYLYADAENIALDCFTSSNLTGTVNAYVNVSNNPSLNPEYKQKAYFMAAYFLIISGSEDYSFIIQYLNYAKDIYPEGELLETIQTMLDYITQQVSES